MTSCSGSIVTWLAGVRQKSARPPRVSQPRRGESDVLTSRAAGSRTLGTSEPRTLGTLGAVPKGHHRTRRRRDAERAMQRGRGRGGWGGR
eukprot:9208624-Pyramimonas_sp.AAC.2